jgi:hypothetical protein
MQVQNKIALTRIVNHITDTFMDEKSEQLISRVENIVSIDQGASSPEVEDSQLIRVVRMLLEEEVFLPAEVIEVDLDPTEVADEMMYVTRGRSLGILNWMLLETAIRVTQIDSSWEIVKLLAVM